MPSEMLRELATQRLPVRFKDPERIDKLRRLPQDIFTHHCVVIRDTALRNGSATAYELGYQQGVLAERSTD